LAAIPQRCRSSSALAKDVRRNLQIWYCRGTAKRMVVHLSKVERLLELYGGANHRNQSTRRHAPARRGNSPIKTGRGNNPTPLPERVASPHRCRWWAPPAYLPIEFGKIQLRRAFSKTRILGGLRPKLPVKPCKVNNTVVNPYLCNPALLVAMFCSGVLSSRWNNSQV